MPGSRSPVAQGDDAQERGRLLVLALDDAVWDYDVRSNVVWWSDALESQFGYPMSEVGRDVEWWVANIHQDDRARVTEQLQQFLSGTSVIWRSEFRFRRHDGSYATIIDRGRLVRHGTAPVRMVGGMMDISVRKQSELTLRDLEQRHRQILDAISDWVLVKGPRSRIIWANRAFREVYGMTNEQLQGLIDAPFSEPDSTQGFIRDDAHVFETGRTLDIPDEAVNHHDGSIIRVHTVKSPIRDNDGRVVMTVGVSRDITETKRMQAQLLLADRMVSVGTLAAGVAHEINNPLSYVISNLDLISEEIRDQDGTASAAPATVDRRLLLELLNEARNGADRVRRIVRDLKTFSRADEERRAPLQIAPVLEMSINMGWNEIRHRARIVKDFGRVPLVEADETRLAQVFINLLVNAAQVLPDGSADTNQIRIVTFTDDAGRAVVEISDTGPGIPEAVIGRIFDPFFTTKPIGVGTGLGLSICHSIVSALGGEISVKSQPGVGTTFRVALPPAPDASPLVAVAPAEGVKPSGRRGRILILDDDHLVGIALSRTLSREHDVELLTEGSLALDRFRAGERFDVFFCDLMMPVLNGMEIHAELSLIAPEQIDKMVLMTGGVFTAQARQFLDTHNNERIEKPFDTHNVRALVRRLLR